MENGIKSNIMAMVDDYDHDNDEIPVMGKVSHLRVTRTSLSC